MTLNSRIYNFAERFDKPIQYLANLLTVLSLLGGAAAWLFTNLRPLWPLISCVAWLALALMTAKFLHARQHLAEINQAFDRLYAIKSEGLVAGWVGFAESRPDTLPITEMAAAIEALRPYSNTPRALDDLLERVSRIERLQAK